MPLVAVLLLAPAGWAAEPYVVLLDWSDGAFVAGAPLDLSAADALIDGAVSASFDIVVPPCQHEVLADLLFEPTNDTLDAPRVGEVVVPRVFRVELRDASGLVASAGFTEPAFGAALGVVEPGAYVARLQQRQGGATDWSLRVRGHAVAGELACLPRVVVNEVEANPKGADAGAEWIEIHNLDADAVDLSLWRIDATHGRTASLTLPQSTLLAPGAFLQVVFTKGQFLDNANESVELRDAFDQLRDATPLLSDAANDARSWSRLPDGSDAWAFVDATPGSANG